ncbi:MAG TPA: hypothetical protein PLA77_10330, partial [Bacteroidales bacterium]|nr:hypothetical protein [Bacteroidales bacterium]
MENEIIIDCPHCSTKLSVPSDKHIMFNCPNCNNEFEYDGRVKPKKSKKKKGNWLWNLIIIVVLIAADR